MKALLAVLLVAACVLADDSENRRSKLPYIADAVGNTLPPPSNGPATVGSPVNLLTPDRYEFYTFDESGELVKRLMTLEEIQAIVAAGEETEGLVTFANENQPTIAFNFSQPPYTKVHSVVTNVQNVLKAQMEAHKNKPLTQPILDTPDVSDSWSLILPSIFGNTGVDIVPDKTSGTFTTPETETIELDNSLSKEGNHHILSSSSTTAKEEVKEVPISVTERVSSTKENVKAESTTTSTTTTTTTTTTTRRPSTTTTTTAKPTSTTTTPKPTTTTSTTASPTTTSQKPTTYKPTTAKLRKTTTTTTTTARPRTTTTTTSKPRTTTTIKPTTKIIRTTPKPTTAKPIATTKTASTTFKDEGNFTRVQVQTQSNTPPTTEKTTIKYEKISTFVPLSTAGFITERSTQRPVQTTRLPTSSTTKRSVSTTRAPSSTAQITLNTAKAPPSTVKVPPTTAELVSTTARVPPSSTTTTTTTHKPSISTSSYEYSTINTDADKFNVTTLTTQSVSPSTTIASTEYVPIGHHSTTEKKPVMANDIKQNEPDLPLFDISQSISQIASDLGNYRPLPTTSDLLDTTQLSDINLESKENIEIDIPVESEKEEPENVPETKKPEDKNEKPDNFVKISTLEPHSQTVNGSHINTMNAKIEKTTTTTTTTQIPTTTNTPITTTIDPVLSESMDDLLSQIVNQAPPSIVSPENHHSSKIKVSTTEVPVTTIKVDPMKEEPASTTTATTKAEIPAKVETKIIETKNMSNDTPQVIIETRISDAEDEAKPIKEKENIKIPEPSKNTENEQNLVKVSESNTKKEETLEIVESNVIKEKDSQMQEQTSNNKVEIEKKETEDKKEPPKKMDEKPMDNLKKPIEITKTTTTTTTTKTTPPITTSTTTAATRRADPTKKPAAGLIEPVKKPNIPAKKPESAVSNANKIVAFENNKQVNDKEKNAEELPFPKVDEFKKKIQKVNIDDKELVNDRNNSWKLISTVSPPKANEIPKDKTKNDGQENPDHKDIVLDFSKENQGLEVTTKDLGEDIAQFTELCNELAFRYWQAMTESIDKRRSFVLSPYSVTSMLAMMFMGAKGATSGEMNDILKLDDMVTFNPHFTLKNISDSIETSPASGVIVSAFVRELFSDKNKGKILTFYKERAQQFYNGHVEEINFKLISDIIRRRTNLLVKRYSWGRIVEYMKANTITMQPPLAAFSANIFQTDCSTSSVEGRDGEMYFVVSPNVRQRRLVPVPAVVYKSGFLAGYDPALDATAAALGNTNSIISTLFLMPGQQGNIVHAEDLEALEKRLLDSNPTTPAWNRLLRTLLPRMGLELQIPRFSHKSLFNVSTTLKRMGLKELFDPEHADLGGLNGPSKDLYLSDMIQSTTFVTCGEGAIGEQHHIEEYPEILPGPQRRRTSRWATGWEEPRDYQRAFHDPHDAGDAMNLPLHLRPRQARLPSRNAQPARLKFDRPFLYFVRHNPSGMILYVGRYNPRLLP